MEKSKGKGFGEAIQSYNRNAKEFIPIRAKKKAENDWVLSVHSIAEKNFFPQPIHIT